MRILNSRFPNSKVMSIQLDHSSPDPVFHDHGQDFQISIPISGVPLVTRGADEHPLEAGHRYIISPGEKHQHFAEKGEAQVLLININSNFLEQVITDRLEHLPDSLAFSYETTGPSEEFQKAADRLVLTNLRYGQDRINIAESEWALANILLAEHPGPYQNIWKKEVVAKDHPAIKLAIDFIQSEYQSPIDLDQLVQLSNMSKYYFLRLFKEKVGMTPSHFISEIRLNHAVQALKAGRENITSIALDSGFGSLVSFERAFKRKYHMTPKDYQKRM
ncbi:MAG: helix-turn-helix domain-containing protein [Tuberibacillus sp.]